jgi:battenin
MDRERNCITGLGELTFLQLSTTYNPPQIAGRSLGYVLLLPFYLFLFDTVTLKGVTFSKLILSTNRYFASGTGAAGLIGAFLWWEVRGLGVRTGVGISAVR